MKNAVLSVFYYYERFFEIEEETFDLVCELEKDKEVDCFKIAHDKENIELLVMWT